MLLYIIDAVYFFVFITSCMGLFLLFRKKYYFVLALCIIFFSLLWRFFLNYQSSRYYSVFIIYGIILSIYTYYKIAGKCFKKRVLITSVMILIHLIKSFSSFRNTYILDAIDVLGANTRHSDQLNVVVCEQEFYRTNGLLRKTDPNTTIYLAQNSETNLDLLLIATSSFYKDLLFVTSQNVVNNRVNMTFSQEKIISLFFSNKKHNRTLKIFRKERYVPCPGTKKIIELLKNAVLKAYISQYDTYIYQNNDRIVWVIGKELKKNTEIIYHLYTDYPELLPSHRIKYGFDNLGLKYDESKQIDIIDHYRVFTSNVPSEYPIAYAISGFNDNGDIIWTTPFSLSQ